MSVLDHALNYAALGIKVIPLWGLNDDLTCRCRKGKNCGSAGKHPMLNEWHLHASDDEDQIIEWFDEQFPYANIGVKMGDDSGIVDIESDTPEGAKRLHELFGTSIITPTYQSARGKHHLFKYSDELPAQATYSFDGIDVKIGANAKGSQSVFPPSRHKAGRYYEWLPGLSLDEVELAEIPEIVLVTIANSAGGGGTAANAPLGKSPEEIDRLMSGVGAGERNSSLLSLAGHLLRLTDIKSNAAIEMVREKLFSSNAKYCPPMEDDEVMSVFNSALSMETARRKDPHREEIKQRVASSPEEAVAPPADKPSKFHLRRIDIEDNYTYELISSAFAPKGYVELTAEQLHYPAAIRTAATKQVGKSFDIPAKEWKPIVAELLENPEIIIPPDSTSPIVNLAEFLLSRIESAQVVEDIAAAPMSTPFEMPDGSTWFRWGYMWAIAKEAKLGTNADIAKLSHRLGITREHERIRTKDGKRHRFTRLEKAEVDKLCNIARVERRLALEDSKANR